jgi:Single-strand binding protein family
MLIRPLVWNASTSRPRTAGDQVDHAAKRRGRSSALTEACHAEPALQGRCAPFPSLTLGYAPAWSVATPLATGNPHHRSTPWTPSRSPAALTRDPELVQSASGPVCRLRLAVDGVGRGRETGYSDVSSFCASGEAAARTLARGWLVAVEGRLERAGRVGADGERRRRARRVSRAPRVASSAS